MELKHRLSLLIICVTILGLRAQSPLIVFKSSLGLESLTESCNQVPDTICFQFSPDTIDRVFRLDLLGDAQNIIDYQTSITNTFILPAGSSESCFTIQGIPDNPDPGETIIVQLQTDDNEVLSQLEIPIIENIEVNILSDLEVLSVCGDSTFEIQVSGANTYQVFPESLLQNIEDETIVAITSENVVLKVEGSTGNCTDIDSIAINAYNPLVTAEALTIPEICVNESVLLNATVEGIDTSFFSWEPADEVENPLALSSTVSPVINTTYHATVSLENCLIQDSVHVKVDPYTVPNLVAADTTICQGEALLLALPVVDKSTFYKWSPGDYLDDSTSASPVARPEDTTTYTLVAISERGYCSDTLSINVNTRPVDVNISGPDTVEICLESSATISATTSPESEIFWITEDTSLSDALATTITVTPMVSYVYIAKVTSLENSCMAFDSVYVRVDSLPDLDTINVIPEKDPYCVGDQIALWSQDYDTGKFPDITHNWMPNDGAFVNNETMFLNAKITAQDTQTYSRVTTNHACEVTDEITINVEDPRIITMPMDTIVCPNEKVPITIINNGIKDLEWMPTENLSCSKCDNPTATTPTPSMYQVQGERNGCPVSGQVIVNIFTPVFLGITPAPDARVEVGTEVTLTVVANGPIATYSWEEGNSGLSETGNSLMVTKNSDTKENYTVSAIDQNGCPTQAAIEIEWFTPPFSVQIPNVFSPNGDEVNQYFRPFVSGAASVHEILIFNRFGQLVFDSDNLEQGWDGNVNGNPAPSDTYVYIVSVRKQGGEIAKYKGDVILMR